MSYGYAVLCMVTGAVLSTDISPMELPPCPPWCALPVHTEDEPCRTAAEIEGRAA